MDDIIDKALREDGGEELWCRLNAASLSSSPQESGLFDDPKLANEVQRFMEKNRLKLSASLSHYVLRRAIARLRLLLRGESAAKSLPTDSSAAAGLF